LAFEFTLLNPPLLAVILLVTVTSIVYYYLPVIKRFRTSQSVKSTLKKISETAEKPGQTSCPKCGGSAEKGYLISQRPIHWSREFTFAPIQSGMFPQFLTRLPSFGNFAVLKANKCEKCKMIFMDSRQDMMLQ